MAEVILFDLAGRVLSYLASQAFNEISLPFNAKRDLEKLETKITTIRNVLLDAQEKQNSNSAVKEWLRRLKIILQEADDLFDELATEALRKDLVINKSTKRKVCNFFTRSIPALFGDNLGEKIKDITKGIDEVCDDVRNFGFFGRIEDKTIINRNRVTTSFVNYKTILGRDDDKKNLVQLLLSPGEENVHVIPIVGMGGLGKTTIAQMIFNDDEIKNGFDEIMWVCVSNDFNIERILTKMLTSLGDKPVTPTMEELQRELITKLGNKKFFLVLDDVWNKNKAEWKKLEFLLMHGARGTRVIVTTRDKNVATIVRNSPPYVLKGLSEDQCLSIFLRWAFQTGEETAHPNLVEIGREIVKRCGGVPLAARTLGGLLALTTKEIDWKLLRDSDMWTQVQNEDDIIPILKLSYDQMPSYLKACFGYCSLFQKGENISKEQLIYHWMAHGLVQSSPYDLEPEDVCEKYFEEFLSRSFLEYVDPYTSKMNNLVQYKMHGLVHELARKVIDDESLILNRKNDSADFHNVLHISLYLSSRIPQSLIDRKKLRTIMMDPQYFITETASYPDRDIKWSVEKAISSSIRLRVLDYGPFHHFCDLPRAIKKLTHLRYLRFRYGRAIPKTLSHLLNLQYLDLMFSRFDGTLKDFGNLINLRVLIFSPQITSLPTAMENFTSLHTLVITDSPCLHSLGTVLNSITSLEHLEIVNCPDLNFDDFEFRSVSKLKYLDLTRLRHLFFVPTTSSALKHLKLESCSNLELNSTRGLSTLQVLEIKNCREITVLPEEMSSLSSLRYLKIDCDSPLKERCQLRGEDWPKIEHVNVVIVNGINIKSLENVPSL